MRAGKEFHKGDMQALQDLRDRASEEAAIPLLEDDLATLDRPDKTAVPLPKLQFGLVALMRTAEPLMLQAPLSYLPEYC